MHGQRASRVAEPTTKRIVELRKHCRGVVVESGLHPMVELAKQRLEPFDRFPHFSRRADTRVPFGRAMVKRLPAVSAGFRAARVGEVLIDWMERPRTFHAIGRTNDLAPTETPQDRWQIEARQERLQQHVDSRRWYRLAEHSKSLDDALGRLVETIDAFFEEIVDDIRPVVELVEQMIDCFNVVILQNT